MAINTLLKVSNFDQTGACRSARAGTAEARPAKGFPDTSAEQSTPVQITALPPDPKGKAVRWNLWIVDAIRDELSALAAERDVSPSQLVQERLWKELRREYSHTCLNVSRSAIANNQRR